ncbi:hypothetical protein GALL_310500 [mine drainage metagenome]|uniref:Uncharacterized protein n=1 Tax=mine drainage metagenome TaxID=410659 RepID=A0A1J5QTW3_9ZZZZ
MFQHFRAKNGIERSVRLWYGGNVTDQINMLGIPRSGLQTFPVAIPFVLAEILRNIVKMTAKRLESKFAGTCVQNAKARRNLTKFG